MNPSEIQNFLAWLHELGIRLEADGTDLRVKGPADHLTPELRSRLLANKSELLACLTEAGKTEVAAAEDPNRVDVSVGQSSLWKKHQAHPLKSFYNVPRALRISGPLNVEKLAAALRSCVRQNEALRTNYIPGKEGPVAVVREHPGFEPAFLDLSTSPDPSAQAETLMQEEASRPFDLEHDCLLRAQVLKLSENEFLFLLTAHHLAADCWSLGFAFQSVTEPEDLWHPGLLLESVWNHYFDKVSAVPASGTGAAFRGFASLQKNMLRSASGSRQRDFWKPHWQIANNHLLFKKKDTRAYSGKRIPFTLPKPLSRTIREQAAPLGTTPHALLLTAFKILLSKWKGLPETVVGMPTANRREPSLHSIIGNFGNNVLVRTTLSENSSYLDCVRIVHLNVLDALDNQDYPLELLQDEFDPRRLLPEVRFIHQSPQTPRRRGDIEVTPLPLERGTSKHPLSLVLMEQPGGFRGWAEFSDAVMDETLLERFLQVFMEYVRIGISRPDTRLLDFPEPGL